jgi:ADP-heptose:LPS heptosyltransferase
MKRILVIRIGRLGDTIMATPVIGTLLHHFGNAVQIDFVTSPGAPALILDLDERVNRIYAVAHRRIPWRLHAVKCEIEKNSRERPYDLVINLECGDECDDFIKFVHCDEFCGRPEISPRHSPDRHCVDTEKSIYAERLGSEITASAETSLQLRLDLQGLPIPAGKDHVVFNPGFSGLSSPGYRSHRGWPKKHWQKLVELFTERSGLAILVNGTSEEQELFGGLLDSPGVFSLFGSSLQTLAAALSNARCLVSVDTGTTHLAAALATPVVALFGPGNPMLTGPYSKRDLHRLLFSGIDCQPCVNTRQQKKCTFNQCMSELDPETVFETCMKLVLV